MDTLGYSALTHLEPQLLLFAVTAVLVFACHALALKALDYKGE